MDIASVAIAVAQIGATFSLAPFDALLQPLMDDTLAAVVALFRQRREEPAMIWTWVSRA